ncbi:MAG TPA: sugar phosphate isomerase/epimerase family protein [Phycisphaerae bacterium]|nr:sugar phosphate isomerase/epimerase family protein [Phycisphaerae bacterium]
MKYSFMTFSCPEATLDEALAMAQRYGYDGIEPRIGSGHKHGIELTADASSRGAARSRAEAAGIALCCLATSCKYADPSTAADQVAETLRAIDLAADVGSPRIRVFGGPIPEGRSRADSVALLVESLKRVADRAAARGVTVCLETHDDWCDPAHVAEVVGAVGSAAVAVNWDVMHPVRAGGSTMDEAFATLRPWIRHLHVHDGSRGLTALKMVPIGTGDFDHRRVVDLLAGIGYDGYLSGEWIRWEPAEVHLPRELATLKRYESEVR